MLPGTIVFQGKTKKGLEILIRYPVLKDLKTLHQYINTLSKERTFIRFQGEQISLKEEKKYLDDQLEKIEKNLTVKLLAFHKNKLIGVSDIKMEDKVSSHIGLFGITVRKDYRNKGVGKLLMKYVFQEAKKNLKLLKIITLSVFASNSIALKIYSQEGFIKYGCLPKGILYKNQFIDHVFMYKNIR